MFKWFDHKHYLLACSCAIALNCEGSILREQRGLQKFGLEAAYILKKDAASSIKYGIKRLCTRKLKLFKPL